MWRGLPLHAAWIGGASRLPDSLVCGGEGGEALALLEVRGVTMDFGGLVALREVSFAIEQGEIVGLIGANGAGKSSLFNIIMGVQKPTAGMVFLDGQKIVGLTPAEIVRIGI